MNQATGTCKCGLPIHLTKHYGWLHDGRANYGHRAEPILEWDNDIIIIPHENLGRTNTMPQLFEHLCKRLEEA